MSNRKESAMKPSRDPRKNQRYEARLFGTNSLKEEAM
jgi:hypothetical protein